MNPVHEPSTLTIAGVALALSVFFLVLGPHVSTGSVYLLSTCIILLITSVISMLAIFLIRMFPEVESPYYNTTSDTLAKVLAVYTIVAVLTGLLGLIVFVMLALKGGA